MVSMDAITEVSNIALNECIDLINTCLAYIFMNIIPFSHPPTYSSSLLPPIYFSSANDPILLFLKITSEHLPHLWNLQDE